MVSIKLLQKKIGEAKLNGLLLRRRQNIKYVCDIEFESGVYAFIPKKGRPKLFVSQLDELSHKEFTTVNYSGRDFLLNRLKKEFNGIIGVEHDFPFNLQNSLKKNGVKFIEADDIIDAPKKIKTDYELLKIRRAIEIVEEAIAYGLSQISDSITEKELARIIKKKLIEFGGELSFCMVQSGKNTAIPHRLPTGDKVKDILLLDVGAKYDGYNADLTRTILLNPTKEMMLVYSIVKEAQKVGIDTIKVGIKARDVHKKVSDFIKSKGFKLVHSTGHGIGLDVHEPPSLSEKSSDVLSNGMAFTIEPGIYLKNRFGVRIEDDFALINDKLTQLSKLPVEEND